MLTDGALGNDERAIRAWGSYRRNRLALFVLFLGWVPVGYILNLTQERLHLPLAVVEVPMFLWLAAIIIEGSRLAVWPCPNCGHSFRGLLPFLPKSCKNCGHLRE